MNSQDTRKVKASSASTHQVHAGEIGRDRTAARAAVFLVAAVAEREQARRRGAEIDHDQEERRQRIDPEMGTEPGQAERQGHGRGGRVFEQNVQRQQKQYQSDDEAGAIDEAGRIRRRARRRSRWGQGPPAPARRRARLSPSSPPSVRDRG